LQYLRDFLQTADIKKSSIYKELKCSENEAKILRLFVKRYLKGEIESSVYQVLSDEFGSDDFRYIDHIEAVKNLLDLGWLSQSNFSLTKLVDLSNLELVNTPVGLSSATIKLLEFGKFEAPLPKNSAYSDHLEYLQDSFWMVDLYQKIGAVKYNYTQKSLTIDRLTKRLNSLQKRIAQRIKKSKIKLPVEEMFEEYDLDQKEKIIFLALLKEEYSSGEYESLREMNTLLRLVSKDEYDLIKNRSLLEEGSTLIDQEIIDYDELLTSFAGVTRSFFINEEILHKIMHPHKAKKPTTIKLETLVEDQEIFELVKPKININDVILHPKTKEILDNLMMQMDKKVAKRLQEWGIKAKKSSMSAKLIFYGAPGTGKTMTAYALSKALKKSVLSFDCSKILSMYVGESEKNVRKIFDSYKEIAKKSKVHPVLLLNEADQFLSSRTTSGVSGSDKMHNQMQNIFLEQIENFEGVLIATTNLLETIDQAFSRRFDYKIEFAKPNFAQRVELWKMMLPKNAEYEDGFDIKTLAKHNLTGGQIKVIVKNTALNVAVKVLPIFTLKDFLDVIEREKTGSFGESKIVGFV